MSNELEEIDALRLELASAHLEIARLQNELARESIARKYAIKDGDSVDVGARKIARRT